MQFSRKIIPKDCGELSPEVLLFLKSEDAKSVMIGNTFSSQRLSWLACGNKLIFINNLNNDASIKVDLANYFSEPCLITCGEELVLPSISSSILLLGCETNLGGLLLFFHPFLKRMIRIVEIDVGVSTVCLVDPGNKDNLLLPDVISCMNGIIAVGGVDGSLILVDLHYNIVARAVKGEVDWKNTNWAWPSSINKTEYICRQTDTWESVQHKINICLETRDSLAFLLNDSDGELTAPKYGQHYSGITCLHYSPIVTALFVGYEVGVWQMWSLPELKLMYSSKYETGQGVSVVGLSLMEPCDDPRHYLYLWVGHSQPQRPTFINTNHMLLAGSPPNSLPNSCPPRLPASEEPPFSIIYSLSFNKKSVYNSYGLLYSDFDKCDVIFEMEMINELDNFISGRILSVNALICVNPSQKFVYNKEEEKEMLRVWSIVWECEFEDTERMVYLTLFDLNQWYNKTPGRPAVTRPPSEYLPIPDTPYYATWYFPPYSQQDVTLALKIDPGSMSATRFFNQLDVHYYPSNISFRCINVGSMRICQGDGPSVLNEIKSKMELQPATAISLPEPLMHACISVGLLPNFDDTSSVYSITINADMARKFLLTICIENDMSNVVLACARRWFDSACTDTTISLDFIADFLWDLFATYRRRIDELCVCLFDCSGNELNFLDNIRITQLNKYMKKIEFIYNILVKDYSTFKKIHEVEHRHLAIKIKTFYVDLTIWFITHEFLPEQSVNLLPTTSLPYNYELLQTNIAVRRVKSHLLIDEMIERYVRHEDGEWDSYPPPSLQSIIRLALRADIEFSVKHFFILYFLQDLLECLYKENYSVNVEEIIQNYEAYFGVREAHTRIAISYRDIDKKKFKDGVETLLHHSVNNSYLEEWEHRHIIMTLHKHNEHALAFRYIKGMKPSLGTTEDVKVEISLNVALGNVSSAFFITQQRNDSRSVLLKHFFQECVKFEQMGRVYRLPLNKFEENNFLEFLKFSNLNVANDLILYFYVDRHRYAEAFVHYERMKILGDVVRGDRDINSRKRDMIMKNLESRFDPKVLLSLKSICEAKNMQPPLGFYEEKWKPTSSYLKFDDTDPKRPLLKSSIKELAYITVWQGQKLMKMREKANLPLDQRKDTSSVEMTPLVKSVEVTYRNENVFSKKRQRADSGFEGIIKKLKLNSFSKFNHEVVANELSTPSKQTLNYSIVQELVSTPIVKQIKTPHGQTSTPGPPSILRVRSGKKDDVSSCDESSSTPRKTLKFTLPADTDNKEASSSMIVSKPLRLEEISEDESSVESLSEGSAQVEETLGLPASHTHIICDDADEEHVSNEEELLPDDDIESEVDSINGDEKSAEIDPVSTLDEHCENVVSLEDRLQQFKSCNRKLNSFINEISLCKSNAERSQEDLAFSGDVECSFISSQSSDDNESRTKDLNLDTVSENQEPLTHIENQWHIDNTNVHSISKSHFELVDDNSSTSDSMDKVYTTIGAPVQKLSTIFETECENEEPCIINTDHTISEVVGEQKDNYGVMDKANYQESDLGDEKLDQECDYMQFSHEENFPKHFDSESENNNDDVEDDVDDDIDPTTVTTPAEKGETAIEKHRTSDDSDDVICIASDSDEDAQPRSNLQEIGSKDYKESAAEDSSSFSRSEGYSEEEDYDDEYDEESYEDDNVGEEEPYEEEDVDEEEEEDYNDKPISDADLHGDTEKIYYQEEECSHSENELSESTVEMENDSCSDGLPETYEQNVPDETEPLPHPNSSPGKDPLPSSSVAPVDPSFIEKIVTFIRTVSDDQLKNIVDVVKTQIDTSKSPLATDSENKNTVIEAGTVSSGLLITDENKKATDESFEDSSSDAARKPELLTSSTTTEPVHQPIEKESTLILDLPSSKSGDISRPKEENIANVDLLEPKPSSELVYVASDSSQLNDLKHSSETVNEAVTQDPNCGDIASNIDECSTSPFNETESYLINSSQEKSDNSDSVVIEQSSETEINVLDSEEEEDQLSDTESSLKTESDASSISHRGSNEEENILKAVELCPVRKNSDTTTYAFSVNCNDQLPISSDGQLDLLQNDVEMNLDKSEVSDSPASPSSDKKLEAISVESVKEEVVDLMDDSDGIVLVSKAPAADFENASVTGKKVEVATSDNPASPIDVEMSVCFSNSETSDKVPKEYDCKLNPENSIVASKLEVDSDDKLVDLTSKPGVKFESDEIHLEHEIKLPEPVKSTSEGIFVEDKEELQEKVESEIEGILLKDETELPKKVESESEEIFVEDKEELPEKVESEIEGILLKHKTELPEKVESESEEIFVEDKEELPEKVDSESEGILLEHKTELPDKVESNLIEKSASVEKLQEVREGLSSDLNDVSKLNAVQKDCTISNASNEHMITVIAGNKTFNKSAFAESSSAVHKQLKVETIVPSSDKVFHDADDNNEAIDNSTDNSIASLDTAICRNDSTLFTSDVDDLNSPDLNKAMFIDDNSIVDVNTPHSKKNKTQPLLIPEVSTTDDWREYLDSNVTVVCDVSKSVKKKTSSLKKVKMVDKCVMTDKRLLWKLKKICNAEDVKTKKESILTSRNEGIDVLNVNTEVESLSRSTQESRPESSKPSRFIRKPVRRITKSSDSEDFSGVKEEVEMNENKSSGSRRSVSDKSEIASVDLEAETEDVDHDCNKPGRVIRKALRRKCSAPFKENATLDTKTEGKISSNHDISSNYSKLSSAPNITNCDDNHGVNTEEIKNVYNPGTSEEFDHNNSDARRSMRRPKICRRSTLADIVELPESDLEKSSNSSGISDRHAMRNDQRCTTGGWESKFKTNLTRLSMEQARHSTRRRRTLSSSSEPPLSGFESDHHSDINQHWLRSSSRSDISESTVESHSSHPNIHKVTGEDVLKMPSRHRSYHSMRNRKSSSERNLTTDANSHDFDTGHPPSSCNRLSSDGASDVQSKHQAIVESRRSRGVEHIQPVRGRRRTISSSSEPPRIIIHSPIKNTNSEYESTIDQNKKKSLSEVKKRLTGVDILNFGRVGRRSKSLHEGDKVLPAASSSKNRYDHQDVNSLPSTSHAESPQLAALIDEYSENRRLTRHQRSLIERSLENTPNMSEHSTPTTPKRRRRSSVAAGSEDEATTPVRYSKRLQEKICKAFP